MIKRNVFWLSSGSNAHFINETLSKTTHMTIRTIIIYIKPKKPKYLH